MRIGIIKDVIIHPKSAFLEIHQKPNEYFFPAIAIIIINAIGISLIGLEEIWHYSFVEEILIKEPIEQFFAIQFSIFTSVLSVGMIYWTARKLYKVQTNIKKLFSTLQFATIPQMIGTIIMWGFLGVIGFSTVFESDGFSGFTIIVILIGILVPAIIWSIILSIIAIKHSFNFKTIDAIVTMIVAGIIVGIIIWIIETAGSLL